MATAKRRCSASSAQSDLVDFGTSVTTEDAGSTSFQPGEADGTMQNCRRLAEVLHLCDDDSSDSWSTSSDSSSSSSSSSEHDFDVYEHTFDDMFEPPAKRPKVESYVEKTVAAYSDEEFKRNFRISRQVAHLLAEEFAKSRYCPQRYDRGGLPAKSPLEHVLSFLWYAANKACIRDVAGRFELAESTHHRMMSRVTSFLLDIAPSIIRFPSDLQQLAHDFEKVSGFPDTVGCVDGSYIAIRCPAGKVRSVYINRHHYLSLTLQGICDNNKRFLDVTTGSPSKIHDARIFKRSRVAKLLPHMCSDTYHILGDAAYPFRQYLMTPIRDYGNLQHDDRVFNTKLSATRVLIENAFGDLKNRFRQLQRLDMSTVDSMSKFILSCCVLHNLCIENGDLPESLALDSRLSQHVEDGLAVSTLYENHATSREESLLRGLGELKRNSLKVKMGL